MKNQELLVVSANAPHDLPVFVDVAGNGKSLLRATSVEIRDGQIIIACETPGAKPKPPQATPKANAPAPAPEPVAETAKTEPAPTPPTPAADSKPAAVESPTVVE